MGKTYIFCRSWGVELRQDVKIKGRGTQYGRKKEKRQRYETVKGVKEWKNEHEGII
jgi:hypothetical protein